MHETVAETYGLHDVEDRLAAVREHVDLDLPVGRVEQMISDSVPAATEFVPDSEAPSR